MPSITDPETLQAVSAEINNTATDACYLAHSVSCALRLCETALDDFSTTLSAENVQDVRWTLNIISGFLANHETLGRLETQTNGLHQAVLAEKSRA